MYDKDDVNEFANYFSLKPKSKQLDIFAEINGLERKQGESDKELSKRIGKVHIDINKNVMIKQKEYERHMLCNFKGGDANCQQC